MPTLASFEDFSNALADAAEKAGAATVRVDARRRMPASGIVLAPDRVLTADHVVEREEDLGVLLADGSRLAARIAGRDPGTDLALLRLDQPTAASAVLAEAEPRIGQIVLALARPGPDGLQASLGIVSAIGGPTRTGRGSMLDRYYRADALPLPGFSGGPLIDAAGRVLGLNTSGFGGDTTITIPITLAVQVANTLAQHGHVRRGYLGIRSQPVILPGARFAANRAQQTLNRDQTTGLLLIGVETGSPAEQSGLMVGDILVGVADQIVADHDTLMRCLGGEAAGQPTPVTVLRGGQPVTLTVTVGAR